MIRRKHSGTAAFSRIDMIILLFSILTLFVLMLSWGRRKNDTSLVQCLNNQKEVSLALHLFAEKHGMKFPPQVSVTNGGTLEYASESIATPHFLILTNYFPPSRGRKILSCPADNVINTFTKTPRARDNGKISYFVSLDATLEMPYEAILGDRNLQADGHTVPNGVFLLKKGISLTWTSEIHSRNEGEPCGVMIFGDGHAEILRKNLDSIIQRCTLPVNRLVLP